MSDVYFPLDVIQNIAKFLYKEEVFYYACVCQATKEALQQTLARVGDASVGWNLYHKIIFPGLEELEYLQSLTPDLGGLYNSAYKTIYSRIPTCDGPLRLYHEAVGYQAFLCANIESVCSVENYTDFSALHTIAEKIEIIAHTTIISLPRLTTNIALTTTEKGVTVINSCGYECENRYLRYPAGEWPCTLCTAERTYPKSPVPRSLHWQREIIHEFTTKFKNLLLPSLCTKCSTIYWPEEYPNAVVC